MKLKRGQKLCKNCNNINGARAHTCKHCNNEFVPASITKKNKFKTKKPKKYEDVDWTILTDGDVIKVIGRSGNYYVNDSGERMYMSDAGVYTVKHRDSKGLVVYSNNGGYGYIYMGPEVQSDLIDNMYRSPHKIVKVNLPVRT
ncbi:MAG: hypothetical protein ACKOPU_05530 [Candidatus Planktophila sp.]